MCENVSRRSITLNIQLYTQCHGPIIHRSVTMQSVKIVPPVYLKDFAIT